MNKDINILYDFIDKAIKNRKYQQKNGNTLRAALKAFDPELNDEERQSIDLFRKNIDHIVNTIYSKKDNSASAASLATYKSRVIKVMNDYEKYGTDPTKMANWNPPTPKLRSKNESKRVDEPKNKDEEEDAERNRDNVQVPSGMHSLELELRPGVKFIFILPFDLKQKEVVKIGSILSSLATEEEGNEEKGFQDTPNE